MMLARPLDDPAFGRGMCRIRPRLAIDTTSRRHTFDGGEVDDEPTTPMMDFEPTVAPRVVFAVRRPETPPRRGEFSRVSPRSPVGLARVGVAPTTLGEGCSSSRGRSALRKHASPYGSFDVYDATFDEMPSSCVVTTASSPFYVINCNQAWLDLCAFPSRGTVVGRTLKCLQGPATDKATLARIVSATAGGRRAEGALVNYKNGGEPFLNFLSISPIFSKDGDTVYPDMYLGVLEDHCARRTIS